MNAYRFGNVVYLPIFKCASTFFTGIFHKHLKWECISTKEINWENDRVFSHLLNPADRHIKGLVEALVQYQLTDLIDDERFKTLLGHCVFDVHSYPIVNTLGEDWCRKIDWILLDSPVDANTLTNKFLQSVNIAVDVNAFLKINQSTSKEKILFEKIKVLQQECTSIYGFYIRDFQLYDDVVSNFNYSSEEWKDITWLKEQRGSNI